MEHASGRFFTGKHLTMKITSAKFIKGVTEADSVLESAIPQIAFIGRSNVGKSTLVNMLVGQKKLAIASQFPGRTQQINIFSINDDKVYFLDLPGYGFASASLTVRNKILQLIHWYLFESAYIQKKVVLIIDANIGPTKDDLEVLKDLQMKQKDIIIVANKIDKIKKSILLNQLTKIKQLVGESKIIPFSSEKKIGVAELIAEIFS